MSDAQAHIRLFDGEPPRWNAIMTNLGLDVSKYEHLKVM